MKTSNCPWHACDLDGRYLVRDRNEKVIFEHSPHAERDLKVRHILLAAAAPDLLLSLAEMVLLAGDPAPLKPFETNNADWQNAVERAKAAIKKTGQPLTIVNE